MPSAERTTRAAWELGARLPGVELLLRDGTLDVARARLVTEVFAELSDENAARAEELLLPELTAPPRKTYTQVERIATAIAAAVDPGLAERRRKSAQKLRSRVTMFREQDGTAGLSGRDLPVDETLAAYANLDARAKQYKDCGAFPGERIDRLRAAAYLDILNGISADDRIACGHLGSDAAPGTGPDAAPDEAPGPAPAMLATAAAPSAARGWPTAPAWAAGPIARAMSATAAARHPTTAASPTMANPMTTAPTAASQMTAALTTATQMTAGRATATAAGPGDGSDSGEPGDGGEPDDGGPDDGGPDEGSPGGSGDGRGRPGHPGPRGGSEPPAAGGPDHDAGRGPEPAPRSPFLKPPDGPPPTLTDLILPLATLLGHAERPGEGHGLGTLDPALCPRPGRHRDPQPPHHHLRHGHRPQRHRDRARLRQSRPAGGLARPPGGPPPPLVALPARINLTITTARLTQLRAQPQTNRGPPDHQGTAGRSPAAARARPATPTGAAPGH